MPEVNVDLKMGPWCKTYTAAALNTQLHNSYNVLFVHVGDLQVPRV
jgi:hypothetical protein